MHLGRWNSTRSQCARSLRPLIFWSVTACCAMSPAVADDASGWTAQTFATTRAMTDAAISNVMAHSGHNSLAVSVKLNGAVPSQRQGEVYVDLRYHAPADLDAPLDLAGQTITAWVYAPSGAVGLRTNPNGMRLFVKDSEWRSEYGPWTHLRPNHWTRVSFTPAAAAPETGFRDADFNPRKVILLGLSIATGGHSTAHFTGPIYLDDIGWGTADAPKFDFENPEGDISNGL